MRILSVDVLDARVILASYPLGALAGDRAWARAANHLCSAEILALLFLYTVARRHTNLAADIGSANTDVKVAASKLELPAKSFLFAVAKRKFISRNAHLSKGNSSKSNVCNLHGE